MWGTTRGLAEALTRFGSVRMGDLTAPAARAAREGVEVTPMQAFLLEILGPIFRTTPECAAIYEPDGRPKRAGERLFYPDLADLLDRLGAEGPGFLYDGDVGAACSEWVLERGGLVTTADLAAYEVAERTPARARFRGREVLTNPPPSSGGILIADALELLDRLDRPGDVRALAEVIASTNRARDEEFVAGLRDTEYASRFLAPGKLDVVAREIAERLGSTTHLSVMDADGACATVTCSNGSCSGVVVPETGMHLNNMLGEEDLNPGGFHRWAPGARVPSMMAPTVVLRDGAVEVALGSAGSNRIRSAIVQTIAGVIDGGLRPRRPSTRRACMSRTTSSTPSRGSTRARSVRSTPRAGGSCAGRSATSTSAGSRLSRATRRPATWAAAAIRAAAGSLSAPRARPGGARRSSGDRDS